MTKILYLDHPQFDLGAFNLFNGLCEVLGPDNVVVFPYKKIYYGQKDDFRGSYLEFLRQVIRSQQLPQGIPPFQQNEDIINGWPNTTPEGPYLITQPERPQYTEDDIVNMLRRGEFSIIVLASSNRVNTLTLARLRDIIGRFDIPIIYVDNGERDELNEHWIHVFHPRVIFKLILTPEVYSQIKNRYGWELHSLPQSSCLAGKSIRTILSVYNLRDVPQNVRQDVPDYAQKDIPDYITFNDYDKPIDVFYALGMTYPKRAELMNMITDFARNYPCVALPKPGQYYHGFLNTIAHSRIAVSMRGSGRDTGRYWDIPLFKTLMLCDGTMGCIHPYPFEDRKTAVFYDENRLQDIPGLIQYYLENEKERRQIASAGYEHLRQYHTNKARAEYFLDIISRETGQQLR